MADFVAVIRRTVDGLSENAPDRRAKVYEKARAAVRRQLQGMKPRPSDEMITRQLAKLEFAIQQVEAENADALPEFELAAMPAGDVDQPEIAPDVVPQPAAEALAPVDADENPWREEEVAHAEPAHEIAARPEPSFEPEPVEEPRYGGVEAPAPVEPEPDESILAEPLPEPPSPEVLPVEPEIILAGEPEPEHSETSAPEDTAFHVPDPPEPEPRVAAQDVWVERDAVSHDAVSHDLQSDVVADEAPAPEAVDPHHVDDIFAGVVPTLDDRADDPAQTPAPTGGQTQLTAWDLPEWTDPVPEPKPPVLQPDEATPDPVLTEAEALSDASDTSPDPDAPIVIVDHDRLEPPEWSWPVDKSAGDAPADSARPATDSNTIDDDDPFDRIPPLRTSADTERPASSVRSSGDEAAIPPRPLSYRAEPRPPRFSLVRVTLALAIIALASGAGFAYWQFRDTVNATAATLVASVTDMLSTTTEPTVSSTGPATDTPASTPEGIDTPPEEEAEVAAVGPGVSKFTQRLQVDGSEIDPGPAPLFSGENVEQEGKSIAAQTLPAEQPIEPSTAPPSTPATEPPGTLPIDPTAPGTPATQAPSPAIEAPVTTAPTETPATAVGDGAKMFLYEERLGQSAPTAIEGSVAWSLVEEPPVEGAPAEPVIQAQISVPERELTALMTIKRNPDRSLPASHVIEFVFSLPASFEGGSIDSVQRVAMKRNEQDRGNALIAVPAKITDDFHMIALNDFQEAVTSNLELLRSRPWIDIPITYRNGRRALLTLEKGTAGAAAFSTAIQAWTVLAQQATPAAPVQ